MVQRDQLFGGHHAFAHFEGFTRSKVDGVNPYPMSKQTTRELAEMAQFEEWGTPAPGHDFIYLNKYMEYSFKFIVDKQPDKILKSQCGGFVAYDTRLLSRYATGVQNIYAVFKKNTDDNIANNKQPWVWLAWCCGWDAMTKIARTLGTAAFGSVPPKMPEFGTTVWESTLDITWNRDHILHEEENYKRVKEILGEKYTSDDEMQFQLADALCVAKKYGKRSQMCILPQMYYNKSTGEWTQQLLMPLHIKKEEFADGALVLELDGPEGERFYSGKTVLTIAMAYQNARLVNKVESTWLYGVIQKKDAEIDRLEKNNAEIDRLRGLEEACSTRSASPSPESTGGAPAVEPAAAAPVPAAVASEEAASLLSPPNSRAAMMYSGSAPPKDTWSRAGYGGFAHGGGGGSDGGGLW